MKASSFAVHHPIFTTMAVFIVIILGIISLSRLPIDLVPDITYPTLNIYTMYENAAPEEIEELITKPIEEAVSAVPGVENVTSFSIEGQSTVRVTFSWGTDLDVAANDIRDRLDRAIARLPEDVDRPILRKYDPASFPIVIFGAYGSMDMVELRRIIDDKVKHRLERIPGVAALDIWGGLEQEVHVNFYADKIKALGLPLNQIISQIKEGNVNVPGGTIERSNINILIRTPGVYTNLNDLSDTVIAMRERVPIQLKEIASVTQSWAKVTRMERINGAPGVRIAVRKQSGANTVNIAKMVIEEVKRINKDFPNISIVPVVDTSDYIQRSITNAGASVVYGGALAVFILFFFLRNIRSTVIIATAIPISIIASFALMYFGGFTLNIMTLGGLALGVGMMVDSAIVVLENIYRMRESGADAEQASIIGSDEVSSAIIAGTLTTLAVFLPLIFIRGMTGVMFKQLAYIVSFSLLCSLFVALTLVPMLSAKMLRFASGSKGFGILDGIIKRASLRGAFSRLYDISGRSLRQLEDRYSKSLRFCLGHRRLVISGSLLLFISALFLIPLVGVEFMPTADEGEVRVYAEMDVGTRLEVLKEKIERIEAFIKENVSEARVVMSRLGPSGWRGGGSHTGEIRISLKPRSERKRTSEEIASFLRKRLSTIPGLKIRTRSVQEIFALRLLAGEGEEKVQIEIQGYDLERADILAKKVKDIVEKVEGVTDVRLSRESGGPEELFIINRQKAADMKLTVSQIADTVQTALTGTVASYYRKAGEEIPIRVKLKDAERSDISDILSLTLANADGSPVILKNVVKVISQTGPMRIDRKNRERTITVSANISSRDMGSVLSDIRERIQTVPIPHDFSIGFGGEYEEQQKAFNELLISFILAIILVYMVMASLYESLRHPLIVMLSVPLAAIGVILMLFFTNTTFNVQSYIGCIMLGGIVVNNAILLVDYTNLLIRRDRMPIRQAVEEAGRRRLRPILMTTMTTLIALFPLALGFSEGGEANAPLARAVIGGLMSSAFITLFVIPTVYSVVEEFFGERAK